MSSTYKKVDSWIKDTIIGLNLCPFTKIPYDEGQIFISLCKSTKDKEMCDFFLDEINMLLNSDRYTTGLICFPETEMNFRDFHDFVGYLEELLEELNISEILQIVTFHPQFFFQGLPKHARANYVNRSPYPLIHVIFSKDIENALNDPKEGEKISLANEKKLNELPIETFKKLFLS